MSWSITIRSKLAQASSHVFWSKAQSKACDGVDVGVRRRQCFSDCRAYGSTLSKARACSGGRRANGPPVMSHTAFGDAVGGLNGCTAVLTALDPRQADRQGPVHRSRADRMHDTVCRTLDHRPFGRRQAAREIRQSSPGFRAAWPFPLCRTGRLDRGRRFQRCDVAEARETAWPCRLGRGRSAEDRVGRRRIESEIEAAIAAWTSAREPGGGDERAAAGQALPAWRDCRSNC